MTPATNQDAQASKAAATKAPAPAKVTHSSKAERAAVGKAARERAPLASQATLNTTGRADAIALLEGQAASRVPELVPIRYGRMSSSPFAFLVGAV